MPRRLFFAHKLATAALDGELDGGVPRIPTLDVAQSDFMSGVSDHLPVIVDLSF